MNDIFSKKLDNLIDEAMPLAVEKISEGIPEPLDKHEFSAQHNAAMKELFAKPRKASFFKSYSKYVSYAAAAVLFIAVATTVTTLDLPFNQVETPDTEILIPYPVIQHQPLDNYGETIFLNDSDAANQHFGVDEQRQHEAASETIRVPETTLIVPTNDTSILTPPILPFEASLDMRAAEEIIVVPEEIVNQMFWLQGRIGLSNFSDDNAESFVGEEDDRGLAGGAGGFAPGVAIDIEAESSADAIVPNVPPSMPAPVSEPPSAALFDIMIISSGIEIGNISIGYVPFGFTLDYSVVSENSVSARFISGDLHFTVRAGVFGSEILIDGNIEAAIITRISDNASWVE